MSTLRLKESFLDENIRHVHWFNGRLLTAESLQSDQQAQRKSREQLGRAIGDGVAYGLEVSFKKDETAPTVTVNAGLAINRLGQAVELPENVDVALGEPAAPEATSAGLFAPCENLTTAFVNAGFYVLVVYPSSEYQERVPLHAIGDSGVATSCGSRYETSGVSFRLIHINTDNEALLAESISDRLETEKEAADDGNATQKAMAQSKIRNLMAHWCLGAFDSAAYANNLYTRLTATIEPLPIGLVERMRQPTINLLQDCDIPLALIYWTTAGPQFVDNWAIRRQLLTDPVGLFNQRRNGLRLERFYQFISHVEDLAQTVTNRQLREIQDYFFYLPPVGLFPVLGAGHPGFSASRFFKQFSTHQFSTNDEWGMSAGQLAMMLLRSAPQAVVDLSDNKTTFQTYRIVENHEAIIAGGTQRLYHAFISHTIHGPDAQDGTVIASKGAWSAYRDLMHEQVFFPQEVDANAINARLRIMAAMRDVMDVANNLSGAAAAFALDAGAALNLFNDLYEVQDDLAVLFQSNIPGTVNETYRQSFGNLLDELLHSPTAGEELGLKPAIQSESLVATVNAQKEINDFVRDWVSESLAVGSISVNHLRSPDGDNLVPDSPNPFRYLFRVANQTNQRLTINLEAAILPEWDGEIDIQNDAGDSITSVTLDSPPRDPNMADSSSAVVTVLVTVPRELELDETVSLVLRATVPAPHNKDDEAKHPLTISDSQGNPVDHSVEITTVTFPKNKDNLVPGRRIPIVLDIRLNAGSPPFEGTFLTTVFLEQVAGNLKEWEVDFAERRMETEFSGSLARFITAYDLDAQERKPLRLTIRITPPERGTSQKIAKLGIRTESTTIGGLVPVDLGPILLRVRSSQRGGIGGIGDVFIDPGRGGFIDPGLGGFGDSGRGSGGIVIR